MKLDKINQEVPQQYPKDNVQASEEPFEYCMEGFRSDPEEFDVVSILVRLLLSTQMVLLRPSADTSLVGTQKDIYGLKVA